MRVIPGLLLAASMSWACSSDGGDPVAARCEPGGLGVGDHAMTLEHDGLLRNFLIHVPEGYDDTRPTPLVFNLHPLVLGGGFFTTIWTYESAMNTKADEAGFIVIQPDGTGLPASWNGGLDCCTPASTEDVDDVGLLRELLDVASGMACVDRKRVYATGMSNGAVLAHRLACEEPNFVAAIAPVVGSISRELQCDLSRRVPVLQISGSEDSLESRQRSIETWRTLQECEERTEVTYAVGAATCETYQGCRNDTEVTHCVVEGGGHCWFSDLDFQFTPGCRSTTDLITPDLVWGFFESRHLP